jgi:hypothetical protein
LTWIEFNVILSASTNGNQKGVTRMEGNQIEKILLTDTDLEAMGLGSAKARRTRRSNGKDLISHIKAGRLVRYHKPNVIAFIEKNRIKEG